LRDADEAAGAGQPRIDKPDHHLEVDDAAIGVEADQVDALELPLAHLGPELQRHVEAVAGREVPLVGEAG
jgi:hypothetical protein